MKIALFGAGGKVGSVLRDALEAAGHEVVDGKLAGPDGCDAAVDFTRPDAVRANVERCLAAGVPVVIGTTGFDSEAVDAAANEAGVPCFHAPNFSQGAVLMMRLAEKAAKVFPRAEIVELHNEAKRDAPSGTAKATAARMGTDPEIHSVRLPGLVAHQEVIFGGPGETLTIRHDTTSREAFVPGVLLALEKVRGLPAGLTIGLDALTVATRPSRRIREVQGEILTAIVTPFKADGSLDLESFRALASHLVENGSDGLVVTGTTGESPTLSDAERFELYEAAVDEVGDRATVVAGTGTYSTEHSVHLTERAHEIGVDGFLIVTPYYNKPPVRGIVEHFKAVAAVSDRPIVAYNIPGRVVLNLETEAIAELSQIPTVRAVKQANDDLEQARRIVELGLDLFAGDDDLVFPFLELGGRGGVCVHTHVVGPQVHELVRLFRAGDVEGPVRWTRS